MNGGNPSFYDTWKIILQIDFILGSFLFRESTRWNKQDKLRKALFTILFGLVILLLSGILYCEKFSHVLGYIIWGTMLQLFATCFVSMWVMAYNRVEIKKLFCLV